MELLVELNDILGKEFIAVKTYYYLSKLCYYVNELLDSYEQYKQDSALKNDLLSNVHKIKGAAASVGLLSLQQVASFGSRC